MQPLTNDFSGARDQPLRIEAEELAQPVAREAHALRAVEAEQLRRRLLEADAALGAGEVRGEDDVAGLRAGARRFATSDASARVEPRLRRLRLDSAVAVRLGSLLVPRPSRTATTMLPFPIAERHVDRFRQPAANARARRQPIDDDLDVVPHLAIEREVVGERHDAAIDAGPHEALLPQVLEQVAVLALLAANHRREHGELRPGRQRQNAADDLLARLGRDRPAALAGNGRGRRGRTARAGNRRSP